jgi:nitroreductase
MDTLQAITTRRAVRKWDQREVPQDILDSILGAGRYAPSPLNSQPWHFIVLRNKLTIHALMQTALHGRFAEVAPVVIVVAVDKAAKVDEWLFDHGQHTYSGVCVLMNMWLATWSLGLGGCWITLDRKIAEEMLDIPDTYDVIGSLALGYPLGEIMTHIEDDRRPLSEMVSYETFK